MPIDRFNELPDLLEQYMEENGSDERWVTVQEFRRFNLTGENRHIIAAFLCGLMYKQIFLNFPSLFHRVERIKSLYRSQITPNRYLVKRR